MSSRYQRQKNGTRSYASSAVYEGAQRYLGKLSPSDMLNEGFKKGKARAKKIIKEYGPKSSGGRQGPGRPPGSKNKPKKSKTRYSTTTTSVKKVNAPNKAKVYDREYNMKGSVKVNESGGILTAAATHAVYLNHGTPVQEVLSSFWRAIVKELCRQARYDIKNWSDIPEWTNTVTQVGVNIRILYVNTPSDSSTTVNALTYTPSSGLSFEGIANGLRDYFALNAPAGSQPKELVALHLYSELRNSANTGTHVLLLSQIDAKQVLLQFRIKSTLRLQNRTLAEADAGETTLDRDAITDIDNQPLIGRLYSSPGQWRNFLDVDLRSLTNPTGTGNLFAKKLVCDDTTGICQFESSTNAPSYLKKPPPGYMLGYKADKKCKIMPGQIMTTGSDFTASMSIASFFVRFAPLIGLAPASTLKSTRVNFGTIQGVGFEKMLDSLRSSGSPISLGYQITQSIMCMLTYKKHIASNPIISDSVSSIAYATDK